MQQGPAVGRQRHLAEAAVHHRGLGPAVAAVPGVVHAVGAHAHHRAVVAHRMRQAGRGAHARRMLGRIGRHVGMAETVVVTDHRHYRAARHADQVERYGLFQALDVEAPDGGGRVDVGCLEDAVAGRDPDRLAVVRIELDRSGPVDALVPHP